MRNNTEKSGLGSRIRDLRTGKGYTPETLAYALNVTTEELLSWENAASYPGDAVLLPLSQFLEMPLDVLLDGVLTDRGCVFDDFDVLVGSCRDDEQYRINLDEKFYYVPARMIPMDRYPIRTVALYRGAGKTDEGVRCYGDVERASLVLRKEIPVPVKRGNEEEEYVLFHVREWQKLPEPIRPSGAGAYGPRYTNRFLLFSARESYELFSVHTKEEYRLLHSLRILSESVYRGTFTICLHRDYSLRTNGDELILSCADRPEKSFPIGDLQTRLPVIYSEISARIEVVCRERERIRKEGNGEKTP